MKLIYLTLLFSYITSTAQFMPNEKYEAPHRADSSVLSSRENSLPKVLSIYPNPLKSKSRIIISKHKLPVTLCVWDVYGREVRTVAVISSTVFLEKGKLVPGVYTLVLVTAEGSRGQKQTLLVE